jgi:hypothetical protein
MTDQTEPLEPADLIWAGRVAGIIDAEAAAGLSDQPNYDRTATSTKRMRSLCQTIIDQAAELERLTPRVLTDAHEIDALPDRSIIRDRWSQVRERNGSHWYAIEDQDAFYTSGELGEPVTVVFVPKERTA